MPIVTLTTDWGKNSFYTASLKGQLLRKFPSLTIVDLSHEIEVFNISQASILLGKSYLNFPVGTIHIIGVNNELSEPNQFIAVEANGHFFISFDSGIISLICKEQTTKLVMISMNGKEIIESFPELEIFSFATAHLAAGFPIEELGNDVPAIKKQIALHPSFDQSVIIGHVIFIDSYGNAISNIARQTFHEVCKNRSYTIFVQSNKNKISQISKNYHEDDISDADLLAIFNSADMLEIAIFRGSAKDLLGLTTDSSIRINFHD